MVSQGCQDWLQRGQIGHKWDKSWTFTYTVQIHEPKCTEICSEKKLFGGLIWPNFCAKLDITGMWWGDHQYLGHKQAERGGKVSLTEGDRERRKNIRNVGPLDSALWSANHSEESNGSTFRLLFLFSRSPCSNCIHYWPNKENLIGWQIASPLTFSLILLGYYSISIIDLFFSGI